jgi:hypothetical protein
VTTETGRVLTDYGSRLSAALGPGWRAERGSCHRAKNVNASPPLRREIGSDSCESEPTEGPCGCWLRRCPVRGPCIAGSNPAMTQRAPGYSSLRMIVRYADERSRAAAAIIRRRRGTNRRRRASTTNDRAGGERRRPALRPGTSVALLVAQSKRVLMRAAMTAARSSPRSARWDAPW